MFDSGCEYVVRVKPKSSKEEIQVVGTEILVFVCAVPEDGQANRAVVKLFKKQLGLRIEIVHGALSRIKRIRVL